MGVSRLGSLEAKNSIDHDRVERLRCAAKSAFGMDQIATLELYHGAIVGGVTAKEYLVQLGFPAACIHLGYDCVDVDAFAELASKRVFR